MLSMTILTDEEPKTFPVEEGALLSDALRALGLSPDMPCGGRGQCGKCLVWAQCGLDEPTPGERAALTPEQLARGERLACQAHITGDVRLRLTDPKVVSRICTEGADRPLGTDPIFTTLGGAVDIGTTTLAARLYDKTGLLATASAPNPQRDFGADVISRIGKAMEGRAGELAACVRQAVNGLLFDLCKQAGREPAEVDALVVTGNTAMLHLLTMTDPSPLAAAPFDAKELFGSKISAKSLDLNGSPDCTVWLPRCMSAFVGGDITTALLAAGLCEKQDTALLVDIGTNGEIALWKGGALLCCSTAAGPAFEGANLSQGMQGAPGAIDHVRMEEGELRLHTIGEQPALGICGSGVADLLACLLDMDILDETGLLDDGEEEWPLTENVAFTQADVRQVQLAKSAVRSGIETLLHEAHLDCEDVAEMAVAGGFGSFLDLHSAAAIGLIPPDLEETCTAIGNAALSGAAMLLWDRGLWDESVRLADAAKTVDLAGSRFFMDQYVENMMFE